MARTCTRRSRQLMLFTSDFFELAATVCSFTSVRSFHDVLRPPNAHHEVNPDHHMQCQVLERSVARYRNFIDEQPCHRTATYVCSIVTFVLHDVLDTRIFWLSTLLTVHSVHSDNAIESLELGADTSDRCVKRLISRRRRPTPAQDRDLVDLLGSDKAVELVMIPKTLQRNRVELDIFSVGRHVDCLWKHRLCKRSAIFLRPVERTQSSRSALAFDSSSGFAVDQSKLSKRNDWYPM